MTAGAGGTARPPPLGGWCTWIPVCTHLLLPGWPAVLRNQRKLRSPSSMSLSRVCLISDPTDCSPPGPSVHGDAPGKNTGVSYHFFLQGIFLDQGLNPPLPHCRQILYRLSHQGSQSPRPESNTNCPLPPTPDV